MYNKTFEFQNAHFIRKEKNVGIYFFPNWENFFFELAEGHFILLSFPWSYKEGNSGF